MYLCYQICFFTGIFLIAAMVVFGGLLDIFDIDGLDLDIDAFGWDIVLPSPTLCVLYITIFGGSGMIIMNFDASFPKILIAVLSGLFAGIVAALINSFILKPLKKAENTSAPDEDELIGLCAVVTEKIPDQGFGEISYTIHGNSYMAPAKSENGKAIDKEQLVAICWIKDYVFYVALLDENEKIKEEL